MALQELSRLPEVTGYSQLGNVISGIGERYAAQRRLEDQQARQDALLAQARQNQLADVASARGEWDRTHGITRGEQLADVASTRAEADYTHERGRGEQLTDRDDQRLYTETVAYLDQARKAKERLPFETDMKALSNHAAAQIADGNAKEAEWLRIVNSAPPQFTATDQEVLNAARIAAGTPDKKVIDQVLPKVLESMNMQAAFLHERRVRAAENTLMNIRAARKEWVDVIQSGIQKGIAPDTKPPALAPAGGGLADEAPSLAPATAGGLLASLRGARGAPSPAPSPAPQPSPPNGSAAFVGPPASSPDGSVGPVTAPSAGIKMAPNFSVLGTNQPTQDPTAMLSGGVSRALEIPGRFDRALGGLGAGFLSGTAELPEHGLFGQIGNALGDSLVAGQSRAEEEILKNAPYSMQAYEIRRQRGLPQPESSVGRPITSSPQIFPVPGP